MGEFTKTLQREGAKYLAKGLWWFLSLVVTTLLWKLVLVPTRDFLATAISEIPKATLVLLLVMMIGISLFLGIATYRLWNRLRGILIIEQEPVPVEGISCAKWKWDFSANCYSQLAYCTCCNPPKMYDYYKHADDVLIYMCPSTAAQVVGRRPEYFLKKPDGTLLKWVEIQEILRKAHPPGRS